LTCDRTALDNKLEQEVVKSRGLERDLGEARVSLLKESDKHDALWVAIGIVFDELGMASEQGTSSLMSWLLNIMDRTCGMARQALHLGVQRSIAIACSHYENIDLLMMIQGFAPGYNDAELDRIKEEVAPLRRNLSTSMEDEILPKIS
jgi:hypothetical protein